MRNPVAAALIVTALLTINPHASEAQTVRVQWDRGVDFSGYQSFSWIEGTSAVDPEVNRVIAESIEDELAIRSILPDPVNPDLHVAYHASAREEFQVTGGYRLDWEDSGAVRVNSYLAGTLVVDLVDTIENRVVWRAIATATVTGNPKKNGTRIRAVVQKMFAGFPPGR